MPITIEGWIGQDLPLGNTEVINATTKLLNYDDLLYRVYRCNDVEVFVYAMYWKQGSIPVREIAGHAPDGCWIANGATFAALKTTRAFEVANRKTAPTEGRDFLVGERQHVHAAWWHIWGENIVDRSFDLKLLTPTLRELWIWFGKRRGAQRDQLLVRIHVAGDLTSAMESKPVRKFLDQFPVVFTATPLYSTS